MRASLIMGLLLCHFMAGAAMTNSVLIEVEGSAVVSRLGSAAWDPAYTNQTLFPGDRLRTLERSRAVVRLSDLSLLRLSELTHIQIPEPTSRRGGFNLIRGLLYFFHRDKPGVMPVTTPTAYAVVLGTEFTVAVADDGSTRLTLIEGEVQITNQFGGVTLKSGESAETTVGAAPRKTAALPAANVIQWVLYYPAVIDPDELRLPEELRGSLDAYRAGDLLDALAKYPVDRQPVSDTERVYRAALLLSVGQIEPVDGPLQRLIAAVQFREETFTAPQSASELMAESYYQQSRSNLPEALKLARRAVELSPRFGFAWARVAELEFSFGRIRAAREAVQRSLDLAPRNAQAGALQGFLLAAENKIDAAIRAFDTAIALDGALANAWLGRGLCRIKQGDDIGGREDLQVAVTLEPQRAVLRSYLGKTLGMHELALARTLDPNDPTAWFYSALLNQQFNRINEGVRDLERSRELNDNRSVFRSRELLDQDRAVRSANLAALYRDAGMYDVSVNEAGRAVADDYANHSAHLFFANSYNELRDPNLVNLRYETPTFSEYLVANLLAPVGGTMLSPQVSQQEYSRLFEKNRLGLSSATFYASDGSWAQSASQFGVMDNIGYALDVNYRSRAGEPPYHDLEQFIGSAQFKVQATPQDSFYFLGAYSDLESGPLKEKQEPNLFAGYHHEWSPGVHTLFLGGRLDDSLEFRQPNTFIRTLVRDAGGTLIGEVEPQFSLFDVDYDSDFTAWSAELQQIVQRSVHTLVAGARYQRGEADNHAVVRRDPFAFPPVFTDPASMQDFETDLERANAYAYYHLRLFDPLLLTGGVSYDHLRYPRNADLPPLRGDEKTREQVSPKAGFVWTPTASTTLRGAYTKSLGGVFYDSSVRLEPTQVAGFVQSYRSLIPELLVGSVPGSRFETFHVGLEHKFPIETYVVLQGEWLRSKGTRWVGVFDYTDAPPFLAVPSSTPQHLEFDERSLVAALNQLVGKEWAFGARYRLSRAELETEFAEHDTLHQVNVFAIWQNSAGFFTRGEALWYSDFWQFNALAGYRFPKRRAEIAIGVLNINDQDYRLNPLNAIVELPHERTFIASLRFNF